MGIPGTVTIWTKALPNQNGCATLSVTEARQQLARTHSCNYVPPQNVHDAQF